ncbi:MAG: protein-L-isoaspartate O-methyltransferase, partial [Rhodomicrobium sp.]|nr:protein-L-isoaspartate O-methyltransferase [Rhodomicrobium sp.]
FVPDKQKAFAYMDEALLAVPASASSPARYLLPPMVLARLLQYADPAPTDRALDIGGVTGYSAAVLAKLCAKVDALEASESLAEGMEKCLERAGNGNVTVHAGALNKGLDKSKPFDVILINGGILEEPKELFGQLAEGGRLVTILRKGWFGQAYLFTKNAGAISGRAIFDAGADILHGFEIKPQFVF